MTNKDLPILELDDDFAIQVSKELEAISTSYEFYTVIFYNNSDIAVYKPKTFDNIWYVVIVAFANRTFITRTITKRFNEHENCDKFEISEDVYTYPEALHMLWYYE